MHHSRYGRALDKIAVITRAYDKRAVDIFPLATTLIGALTGGNLSYKASKIINSEHLKRNALIGTLVGGAAGYGIGKGFPDLDTWASKGNLLKSSYLPAHAVLGALVGGTTGLLIMPDKHRLKGFLTGAGLGAAGSVGKQSLYNWHYGY